MKNDTENKNMDTTSENLEEPVTKLELTKEELEKKLQSESDRRVNEALKTAKAKWQSEYNEKIKTERREAERLAKLSEEERQRELDEKYKKELSMREKELLRKEMKLEAVNILAEKKLPVKFSDILIGDTAEETQDRIKNFEMSFREEVETEVNRRLKGSIPKSGTSDKKKFDMNDLIRGSIRRR